MTSLLCYDVNKRCICQQISVVYLPNFGTEEAVGGATSTSIRVSTIKLPNKLVAMKKNKGINICPAEFLLTNEDVADQSHGYVVC